MTDEPEPELIWSRIHRGGDDFLASLSAIIGRWEAEHPGRLTPVGEGPVLLLASDYAGQHAGSRYETFSFLVADHVYLWLWDEMRRAVREKFLSNGRRMAYKSLKDGQRQRALVPFLRAANAIQGVLFTLAVDKTILPALAGASEETMRHFPRWKPASIGKLAVIASVAATLVAGLADPRGPGQHLLWISDHDDILPDESRAEEALLVAARVLNAYVSQEIGDVTWMTPSPDEDSRFMEDLLALPDLAAGVLAELLTAGCYVYDEDLRAPVARPGHPPARKSAAVRDWYVERGHPLARVLVVVDECGASDPYQLRVWDLPAESARDPAFDWSVEGLPRLAERFGLRTAPGGRGIAMPRTVLRQAEMLKALNLLRNEHISFGVGNEGKPDGS
jgi:hypothetical protein